MLKRLSSVLDMVPRELAHRLAESEIQLYRCTVQYIYKVVMPMLLNSHVPV